MGVYKTQPSMRAAGFPHDTMRNLNLFSTYEEQTFKIARDWQTLAAVVSFQAPSPATRHENLAWPRGRPWFSSLQANGWGGGDEQSWIWPLACRAEQAAPVESAFNRFMTRQPQIIIITDDGRIYRAISDRRRRDFQKVIILRGPAD